MKAMKSYFSFARFACATGLLLSLGAACAGRSFTRDDGPQAGNDQGGSVGEAGKSSSGGKPAPAGAGNATSSAGAGSAGSGYAGEGCTAPPDSGTCDAYGAAWYHDASTGICRPFVFGGCGGGPNNYASLAECQKACSGGEPNYDACKVPSDRVVTGGGCCGVCDGPQLTSHDLIAYNPKYDPLFACGFTRDAPAPGANAPACAPCPPIESGTLRYFVPDCVKGQCSVVDLRASPLTECQSELDCQLRRGSGCCQSCTNDDLIAIRKDVSLEDFVCPRDLPVGCPGCAAPPTADRVTCWQGHCAVLEAVQP
jgi:hypothetical protein